MRFGHSLQEQGLQASYKLLRTVEIPASLAIARGLELELGEPVALIERLGLADEQPISIGSGYFPLSRFPDILQPKTIKVLQEMSSISRLMQTVYHCDHIRRSTLVSARSVQAQDAKHLKISLNQPILLVESTNIDQMGNVIEYGVTRMRGDRVELVFADDSNQPEPNF